MGFGYTLSINEVKEMALRLLWMIACEFKDKANLQLISIGK
jgi:hypothetical protein